MSKKQVTRYSCDVLECRATKDVEQRNGDDTTPMSWGFITINQLRGHSNIGMWLCPHHFIVIDGWNYDAPIPEPTDTPTDSD